MSNILAFPDGNSGRLSPEMQAALFAPNEAIHREFSLITHDVVIDYPPERIITDSQAFNVGTYATALAYQPPRRAIVS